MEVKAKKIKEKIVKDKKISDKHERDISLSSSLSLTVNAPLRGVKPPSSVADPGAGESRVEQDT